MFILNRKSYYSIQNKRKKMTGHGTRFRENDDLDRFISMARSSREEKVTSFKGGEP